MQGTGMQGTDMYIPAFTCSHLLHAVGDITDMLKKDIGEG